MDRYLITAAYAEGLGDNPQAYETDVDADSAPHAEQVAQEQCRRDNGHGDAMPGDGWYAPLVDVYARPAPVELSPDDARLVVTALLTAADRERATAVRRANGGLNLAPYRKALRIRAMAYDRIARVLKAQSDEHHGRA